METESTTTTTETTEPTTDTAVIAPTDNLTAEIDKWKNLARKHEERAKENADKAKRLDALEEQSKSELEKAAERAARAEAQLEELRIANLRMEVAGEKGVPAALLSGATKEELVEAAEKLLAFKGTTPKAPAAAAQGAIGSPVNAPAQITSREVLKTMSPAEIAQAKREGRLNQLLGVK